MSKFFATISNINELSPFYCVTSGKSGKESKQTIAWHKKVEEKVEKFSVKFLVDCTVNGPVLPYKKVVQGKDALMDLGAKRPGIKTIIDSDKKANADFMKLIHFKAIAGYIFGYYDFMSFLPGYLTFDFDVVKSTEEGEPDRYSVIVVDWELNRKTLHEVLEALKKTADYKKKDVMDIEYDKHDKAYYYKNFNTIKDYSGRYWFDMLLHHDKFPPGEEVGKNQYRQPFKDATPLMQTVEGWGVTIPFFVEVVPKSASASSEKEDAEATSSASATSQAPPEEKVYKIVPGSNWALEPSCKPVLAEKELNLFLGRVQFGVSQISHSGGKKPGFKVTFTCEVGKLPGEISGSKKTSMKLGAEEASEAEIPKGIKENMALVVSKREQSKAAAAASSSATTNPETTQKDEHVRPSLGEA